MRDLFGDEITSPTGRCAPLLNAAHGFAEFWASWPRGTRKVAKQQCLNKWAKYGCAENATLIIQHVEAMKRSQDWLKDNGAFIPAPLVYLNQRRWDGEVEDVTDTDSRKAVETMAGRVGIGKWDELVEQWPLYKNRVLRACGVSQDV
jgi:hypothetical protein